jgi:hypothetical protein
MATAPDAIPQGLIGPKTSEIHEISDALQSEAGEQDADSDTSIDIRKQAP